METGSLDGLYFPYANVRSLRTLNAAALYLDRILLMDPCLAFCQDTSSTSPVEYLANCVGTMPGAQRDYVSRLTLLVSAGVIEFVDPRESFIDFGEEIVWNVRRDLIDAKFRGICAPLGKQSWVISAAKLTGHHDYLLRDLLVSIPPDPQDVPVVGAKRQRKPLELTYSYDPCAFEGWFPVMSRERLMRTVAALDKELDEARTRVVAAEGKGATRNVVVPFPVGESIMITHAVATAAKRNAVPFCDSRLHLSALGAKIESAYSARIPTAFRRVDPLLNEFKGEALSHEVLNATVPSLEGVPTEEILEFRLKNADAVERFRVEMRKLAVRMRSSPWHDGFLQEAAVVVQTEVKPALKDLKREIRRYRSRWWVDAVTKSISMAPLPLVGALWAGAPPEVALGIGAGLGALAFLAGKRLDKQEIKGNGFALLFDVGKLPATDGRDSRGD
jgi:hypothetical protein